MADEDGHPLTRDGEGVVLVAEQRRRRHLLLEDSRLNAAVAVGSVSAALCPRWAANGSPWPGGGGGDVTGTDVGDGASVGAGGGVGGDKDADEVDYC